MGLSGWCARGGPDGRLFASAAPTSWLGNRSDAAAALEITLIGPELEADGDIVCAVAGAEFDVTVDGCRGRHAAAVSSCRTARRLRFGARGSGRARDARRARRLRRAADVRQPRDHLVSRMGPFGGRALRAGDELPVGDHAPAHPSRSRRTAADCPPAARGSRAHADRTTRSVHRRGARARCSDPASWSLPQSNRMGYRLDGPAARCAAARRHAVGRDADRVDPGAGVGTADSADGGSADDRRLPDDRHRDHRRPADGRAARARRLDRVQRLLTRRGARRAARAGSGARWSAVDDADASGSAWSTRSALTVSAANVAARAAHDVQGRRPRGLAGRRCTRPTTCAARSTIARRRGLPVTVARRRLERARRRRRRPRRRDARARRRRRRTVAATSIRADAGVTINGLVRWTINRGLAGPRGVGRHAGHRRRRVYGNAHFRGRLISELIERVTRRRRQRTGASTFLPRRWNSATTTAGCSGRARSSCRPISGSRPGEPAALRAVARESLAFRKRTQPLESPSAGCIFQNPGSVARYACRTASRLRPARSSIAPG